MSAVLEQEEMTGVFTDDTASLGLAVYSSAVVCAVLDYAYCAGSVASVVEACDAASPVRAFGCYAAAVLVTLSMVPPH